MSAEALRPVVAEMRAEARQMVRFGLAIEAVLVTSLVLTALTEPWVVVFAALPGGFGVTIAPLVGRQLVVPLHRQVLITLQGQNMRPLVERRMVEPPSTTAASLTAPRKVIWAGVLLPVIADAVVLAWWARGGTPDGDLPLVPLLAFVFILYGGMVGGSALGAAWGLRAIARDWEVWEGTYGVVVVRPPVPLPDGLRGATLTQRETLDPRASRPPALTGEGWFASRPEHLFRMA